MAAQTFASDVKGPPVSPTVETEKKRAREETKTFDFVIPPPAKQVQSEPPSGVSSAELPAQVPKPKLIFDFGPAESVASGPDVKLPPPPSFLGPVNGEQPDKSKDPYQVEPIFKFGPVATEKAASKEDGTFTKPAAFQFGAPFTLRPPKSQDDDDGEKTLTAAVATKAPSGEAPTSPWNFGSSAGKAPPVSIDFKISPSESAAEAASEKTLSSAGSPATFSFPAAPKLPEPASAPPPKAKEEETVPRPAYSFGTATTTSLPFSFGASAQGAGTAERSAGGGFTFGAEAAKPGGFTFGSEPPKPSGFTFGSEAPRPATTPTFGFGSSGGGGASSMTASAPKFSFGFTGTTLPPAAGAGGEGSGSKPAGAFSFGTSGGPGIMDETAPALMFNPMASPAKPTAASVGSITFGAAPPASTSPFGQPGFGSPVAAPPADTTLAPAKKPTFGMRFGAGTTASSMSEMAGTNPPPAFTFGAPQPATNASPFGSAFGGGSNASAAGGPFAFGAAPSQPPPAPTSGAAGSGLAIHVDPATPINFNFGGASPSGQAAPFTFGAGTSAPAGDGGTGGFSVGATAPGTARKFSVPKRRPK